MSAVLPSIISAQERLQRSREAITAWLRQDEQARAIPQGAAGASGWLSGLRRNPLAAIALDALAHWWQRRPLVATTQVAAAAGRAVLTPLLRDHPVAVLGAAALAGALVVRIRPWRWLVRPALLAGLASQVAAQVFAHLARPRDRAAPGPR